jgi:ubiquinone/menaquinone biosynthesis C-methylase UbiE
VHENLACCHVAGYETAKKEATLVSESTGNNPAAVETGRTAAMAKLEFDDEGSRLVEAINTVPDTIERRRAIMRTLNLKTSERVLDVGSGPGHQALEMSPMVGPSGRVDGVDVSESMIRIARARCEGVSNVEFHASDALHLPFPDATFDAVMSSMVFEYLPDVPRALQEVHRVLKPGGRVAIHGCALGATLWRSSDPARMARMLAVWDSHLEDKALPQTLNTKLREAGFRQGDPAVYVMFNPMLNENTYSHWLIEFVRAYNASQGVAEEEIDAWTEDLRRLGAEGDYFYSSNEYIMMGWKP